MTRHYAFAWILVIGMLSVCHAQGATTSQLVKREGWLGLLCCDDTPDCICKYFRPDYCKKPLPCPCGPLPPNLSGGCGPTRWWGGCFPWRSCGDRIDKPVDAVEARSPTSIDGLRIPSHSLSPR